VKNLALDGGVSVRTTPYPQWPQWDMREEQALLAVLHSGNWWRVEGTQVKAFEREFAAAHDADYGIAVTNGSAALEVCLRAADLKWGDEVITTPYTFIATATACLLVGVIPRFVDILPDTWNLDPAQIEALITPRTRAIMPVHLGGEPADMDSLRQIADAHDLLLIEDSAQAHGAAWKGQKVGALGHMGTFSFQNSKNMTGGEGGIIVSNHQEWGDRCWSVMNVGRRRDGGWYEHIGLASNYRLSEWPAAVLRIQIERLEEQSAIRSSNGKYLARSLGQVEGLNAIPGDCRVTRNAYHLFKMIYDPTAFGGRDAAMFVQAMKAEGIPMSAGYPQPLNESSVIIDRVARIQQALGLDAYPAHDLPVCQEVCRNGVWLPQYLLLAERGDLDDVVRAANKIQCIWRATS
jgi:dTDP-4-amino-4,6-dideoxygalactose transaminase